MKTVKIDELTLNCTLRYSARRRTVQIRLATADYLEIAAPAGMSWDKIQQLLTGKYAWIRRQIRRLEASAANPANSSLTHGSIVLYQGKPHTLLLLADGKGKPNVTYAHCAISVHLGELVGLDNDPVVYHSLKKWYLAQALVRLVDRTNHWASQIGVHPTRISLRDQKTRWGSCSSRGTISYNWRIIMAPPEVLDYLVIHELCHMIHHNHSAAFWAEVARWTPDCRNQRRWLRLNGTVLSKILSAANN